MHHPIEDRRKERQKVCQILLVTAERKERTMRYGSYDDYMDDLGFDEEAYEEGRWNHLEEMRDAESEEREWD